MRLILKLLGAIVGLLVVAAAALWFFLFRPPPRGTPGAPVMTASGPLLGLEENGLTVYRGVPYAAPPVGPLRWRTPQPVAGWTKPRDAFAFSKACPQIGGPIEGMLPPEPQSEDCLFLNVWTPARPGGAPLPVIVWVHGGSNTNGSASAAPYGGAQLARKGVVLVSFNYRLGVLGFLAHPELTRESGHDASGNYGMMDIVAALRWVRANARAFGGDPANVTVMGQSAGAWNMSHLQISPLARGLYRRIIAMSGGDFGPAGTPQGLARLSDAEAAGVRFANSLGAHSLAELRALPVRRLVAAPILWRGIPNSARTAGILDGWVVPVDPYDGYAGGHATPVDLLTGYTSEEGVNWAPATVTAAAFRKRIETDFSPDADRFLALYPAADDVQATRATQRIEGERAFKWQVATWARLHAQRKLGRVFFYRFSHRPGIGPFRRLGPGHGSELGYVFDYPKRGMRYGTQWPWTARRDVAMIDAIQSYWVNFARTGDPNGSGLPTWAAFDGRQRMIDFADRPTTATWLDEHEHGLMDDFMASLRKERAPFQ